ncbi:hypothetical protein FRC07_004492 [Ceratobasidium sp. 392]|nr:hypothetical protein FRC07_004492 [Ceratobasidium sp. 392]
MGGPSKRLPTTIQVEYKGRKASVRRSGNYEIMVSTIKKEFKNLRTVSNDRISLSAVLEGQNDPVEVTDDLWSSKAFFFSKLVMVFLDSSSSEPKPKLEDEESGPQKPQTAQEIISASIRASGDLKQVASTVPEQPEEWDEDEDEENENIITIEYIREPRGMATDDQVLTTPDTKIIDLKAWIVSQDITYVDKEKATFWFEYNESNLAGKQTVRDLEMDSDGGKIEVYINHPGSDEGSDE